MPTERKRTGIGSIAKVNEVRAANPSLIATGISTLFSKLNELIDAFNGRISLGDATSYGWAGNLDAVEVEWTTPAVPDTEFVIPHLLGRIPVRVERTRANAPCDVYDSGTLWTSSHVYLKADEGSVLVLLRIS